MGELADLRNANKVRCWDFGHGVKDWSVERWALAVAGECGEMCNAVKKVIRGHGDGSLEDIQDEIADIVIYLDLLCAALNVDLASAVVKKFNETSTKIGSQVKLDLMDGQIALSPIMRRYLLFRGDGNSLAEGGAGGDVTEGGDALCE